MASWLNILVDCAENMKNAVVPLLGSSEAKEGSDLGAGGDIKKRIDLVAEDTLIQTLRKHQASCTLVSEESGVKTIGNNPLDYYVAADPIDGTANAVRGLPFVAVSLAGSKRPMLTGVEVALVAEVMRNTTYTAEKGHGAYKNGARIRPSGTVKLEEALVGVDFSTFQARQFVDQLAGILKRTRHLRHLGANALEICYVADGTSDAFIDIRGKLRITDIAAAYLILVEAGGVFTTPEGDKLDARFDLKQRVSLVAAANKSMHGTIVNMTRRR